MKQLCIIALISLGSRRVMASRSQVHHGRHGSATAFFREAEASMNEQTLNDLVAALTELMVPLRTGEPLDEGRFRAACKALDNVRVAYSNATTVPKPLARLLAELHAQMLGVAASRNSDEERETVEEWADDLLELAVQILE